MHWCASMCCALCLRTAYSILFILVTFPCMCWVRSFSPFYSLSLSLEICSCISATISGFWHRKVQLSDHNAWNRTPASHTFLIRFPVESWSFISNANWNCCHNHTGMVLGSGLIHYHHCLNVLIGKFWEFFFSFLCTLPLGRRLGWRALRECIDMKNRMATCYKRDPYFFQCCNRNHYCLLHGSWYCFSFSALSISQLRLRYIFLCPHYLFWIVVQFCDVFLEVVLNSTIEQKKIFPCQLNQYIKSRTVNSLDLKTLKQVISTLLNPKCPILWFGDACT